MSGIDQFVPMLHRGDAVGEHTLELCRLLRAAGVDSQIYVELDDPETAHLTKRAASYPGAARPGDLLLYQYATASDLSPWLVARHEPFVVNYHNITPVRFFAPWDDSLAGHQARAIRDLAHLGTRASLGVAVSEFNRDDLVQAGFAATAVVPPVVARATGTGTAPAGGEDGAGTRPRHAGRWLSVGRLAPNKAIEDTLVALMLTRARHDPGATLTVVGKPAVPAYARALRAFTADLGLRRAVDFVGHVSNEQLSAAYDEADVLVVSSEHEGFCLPVVEAMAHAVPVVAFRAGAIPDVLGPAGVLVERRDPSLLAAAVDRLRQDGALRRRVVAEGHRRGPALGLEDAGPRLVELLVALQGGGALPEWVQRHGGAAAR